MRATSWPDRALEWHDAAERRLSSFVIGDAYVEHSASCSDEPLPSWTFVDQHTEDPAPQAGWISKQTLQISCGLAARDGDGRSDLALALLDALLPQLARSPVRAARVVLIAECARLPLYRLPRGIDSLSVRVPPSGFDGGDADEAIALFRAAGMAVLPGAVSARDAATLRSLVLARAAQAEARLRTEGTHLGSGTLSYAELCSRGVGRWDLLLHDGSAHVRDGEVKAGEDIRRAEELLVHVAEHGAWAPLVRSVLGSDTAWQASLICSRRGAPAGRWHADGGHSRYSFGGKSADAPYALCVFVPLVTLRGPTVRDDAGAEPRWRHGLGFTAFWPGSHRHAECLHLGAAAAARMHATVPGAPLDAGGAIVYDYRTVHAGSPNDGLLEADGDGACGVGEQGGAVASGDGVGFDERPVLQLTYRLAGYRDRERNYGYDELFT